MKNGEEIRQADTTAEAMTSKPNPANTESMPAPLPPTAIPNQPPHINADHTPSWKKVAEVVAIFIALGLLIVNICQLRANRTAAEAAKSSADTAADALIRTTRPWVGVEGTPVIAGALKMTPKQIQGVIWLSIKNYGSSPAIHANADLSFYLPADRNAQDYLGDFKTEAEIHCRFAEQDTNETQAIAIFGGKQTNIKTPPTGFTIFPGTLGPPVGVNSTVNYTQSKALEGTLDVIGCIVYSDQFGKTLHHTRFCFRTNGQAKLLIAPYALAPCPIGQNAD